MELIVFGLILPWVLIAAFCWVAYQLVRQNGRLLLRLETIEEHLEQLKFAPASPVSPPTPQIPSGLPIGSVAPAFDLPALAGGRAKLSDYRGRRVLLVFFNPGCGFCVQMMSELAPLLTNDKKGPLPVIITNGNAEENRNLFMEHNIHFPILLQEETEISQKYQCGGTPMGYLLDEEGRISSEMAAGSQALLSLLDAPLANSNKPNKVANRSLAESKIQRNGLPAGTPAPNFRLPRVDSGELTLQEFRGKKVLLVFSSPDCGPCMSLAPALEASARETPDIQVLMVSRGDIEENRIKVMEHGLSFPVALQKAWEISKEYAMFATPIAYLIDEEGIITRDVAIGGESILTLLSGSGASLNQRNGFK